MPLSPKTPLMAAALASLALAGWAGADPANAADGFVGVTHGDQLVTFHSDTIPGLSAAHGIDGLPGGERLVALDALPGSRELLALGASGTVYGLDAAQHKVTRTVAGFGAAITPNTPVTLTVAPDGATAQVVADGHAKVLDLASGAVKSDVPGAPAIPALMPAATGPTTTTTTDDGLQWILTGVPTRARQPHQSRLFRFDPATGKLRGQGSFFFEQLDAIAATGPVADDTTAPTATVRIPRQTVRDAVRHRGFVAIVKTGEPGQTVMSARLGGKYKGFGFATAIERGELRVLASEKQASIRKLAGRRLRLHIAVHDWAGNTKTIDRYFTLAR
jgi:hypothetical protein